jgi:hypothetical protein
MDVPVLRWEERELLVFNVVDASDDGVLYASGHVLYTKRMAASGIAWG